MECVVLRNQKGIIKSCVGFGACETCKVPSSVGYFYDRSKARWLKKFEESHIMAADRFCREAMIDGLVDQPVQGEKK